MTWTSNWTGTLRLTLFKKATKSTLDEELGTIREIDS
jgi:hypothetical protein